MGPEEWPEEGQVIIARILQMRFTLRQDGLGPSADQGIDRLTLLLWGFTRLPAADNVAEQRHEGIGLLLMLLAIVRQRFLGLLMQFLHTTEEHRDQIIESLGSADTNQGDGDGVPLRLREGVHPRHIEGPGLLSKSLELR